MAAAIAKLNHSTSYPCAKCNTPLPLRPKRGNEIASDWQCVKCGATYHAVRMPSAKSSSLASAVRAIHSTQAPSSGRPLAGAKSTTAIPQGSATTAPASRIALPCTKQTAATRSIDAAVIRGEQLTVASAGPPLLQSFAKRKATAYDRETERGALDELSQSLGVTSEITQLLKQGSAVDGDAFSALVHGYLNQATQDLDLFVRLTINPHSEAQPGQHSLHVAMLASAMGASIGWDSQSVIDVGIGCLMHDVGMLAMPDSLAASPAHLDADSFQQLVMHPLETFEFLAATGAQASPTSRMVAFQMHERCDGTGYPRRRTRRMIHQAARVAAVADVYLALVSPRPHRAALMPYHAVRFLLDGAKSGKFDPTAIRALLKTVSLFPIGSFVALNDGRVARVLRSSTLDYTRPTIEAWQPGELEAPGTIIDLARTERLAVVTALPRLGN